MDLIRWCFGITTIFTDIIVILGILIPEFYNSSLYFCMLLFLITSIGVFAFYSLQYRHLKYLTIVICGISTIAVLFWFLLFRYPFLLFFTIVNLCYIFVYSLFFTLIPYYATKLHEKYENSNIRGYHIHENTYGLLFITLGLLMVCSIWWQTNIVLLDFLKYHLFLYLGTAFVIIGAFLFGRDYQDVKKKRFIQKIENQIKDSHFHVRKNYYQLCKSGIIFTLFGITFLFEYKIWANLTLDRTIFIIIGFIFIISGAIMSGINPTYFTEKIQMV
ncbi:MAG: hypothetical protein ACTSQQ_08535 [Candidatus Helarchaeota archaeon]